MKRNPWGACLEIDNGTGLQAACTAHVKSSVNQNQVDWTFPIFKIPVDSKSLDKNCDCIHM